MIDHFKINGPAVISFSGGTFRSDRPAYSELIKFAGNQGSMFGDEPLMECFCHD